WANWRLVLPGLAEDRRVVAPDVVGFGYTTSRDGGVPDLDAWLDHVRTFLDVHGIRRASLVGNSFGGALALWFAVTHPDRVSRLVLMGSVGAPFELTPGLDAVWGYEPSVEAMEELLEIFVHDRSLLPANLAELRHRASTKPGAQERWAALFPEPRQRWIDRLVVPAEALARLEAPTLLFHGREDRVIPLSSSLHLEHQIGDARLLVLPHTGHWVQVERAAEFTGHVRRFLAEGDDHP
ncbi:MAG: alpha/beta hydrolase fold protein, partial [Nocardioidaceae bacterium]|nr:alpha/beta hydrolase fold protein [Nocardioidaceae bacterium]